MAPLCLRHIQGSMQRNPCRSRLLRICRTGRQIRLKPPGAAVPEPPRYFFEKQKGEVFLSFVCLFKVYNAVQYARLLCGCVCKAVVAHSIRAVGVAVYDKPGTGVSRLP